MGVPAAVAEREMKKGGERTLRTRQEGHELLASGWPYTTCVWVCGCVGVWVCGRARARARD